MGSDERKEMPERIQAANDNVSGMRSYMLVGASAKKGTTTEYVRGDLYEQVERERDAARSGQDGMSAIIRRCYEALGSGHSDELPVEVRRAVAERDEAVALLDELVSARSDNGFFDAGKRAKEFLSRLAKPTPGEEKK